MKKVLLVFLIATGGCLAIVDDSNIAAPGFGGTGPGSGGSGAIATGGTVGAGTGGLGLGGNFGSGGILGTGGSGAATVTDGGAGTDGPPVGPDAGARDGGARVDAGTGTGGGAGSGGGTGGVTGTGGSTTTAAVCSSKVMWSNGNGPNMRPGVTCNSCHGYSISGTIYPTVHEPTNCNGVNGSTGVKVIITGANGTTLTLTPNSAGNFFSNTNVGNPFTVRVTSSAGTTRVMSTPQTNGNCNSCHTQNGANGAPGRIMVP